MELIFGLLIELVVELFGVILFQIPFEVGLSVYKNVWQRANRNPVAASLGYLVLGLALGALSELLHSERLTPAVGFPGLSLFLVPLIAGGVMHFWGEYRRSRAHPSSNLATFYGGAAFGFGFAAVRFYFGT